MKKRVDIGAFVRRQTKESVFSHWEISDDELLARVEEGLDLGLTTPGYRDGVILVSIDPAGIFSSTVQLKAGDKLAGVYEARIAGEQPRKKTWVVGGQKMPAMRVEVVLYHEDVLRENHENSVDATYEIVSVNASPTMEKEPISTGALIANHFQLSGGTATKMTDSEFVEALKTSVLYWKDKAHAGG